MDHVLQEGLVMMGVFIVIHSLPVIIHSSKLGFLHLACAWKRKLDRQHCCWDLFEVNPLPKHNLMESFILCVTTSLCWRVSFPAPVEQCSFNPNVVSVQFDIICATPVSLQQKEFTVIHNRLPAFDSNLLKMTVFIAFEIRTVRKGKC